MLDFYIIRDDQSKPKNPKHGDLLYAGWLDGNAFGNLKRKGIIEDRFDYYSDFRWEIQLIEQIRQTIQKIKMDDPDVHVLIAILDLAKQHESGLIAYGD